jgi:putative RecB family exonuclease
MTAQETDKSRQHEQTGEQYISYSQIRAYAACSLQWWFSRRFTPEFTSSSLLFGSSFHAACEFFYKNRLEGNNTTSEEMRAAFNQKWSQEKRPVHFSKKETAESLQETAGRMFEAFLAAVTPGEVIAIEQRVRCKLADGLPPLVGYVDLLEIVKQENGKKVVALVDIKTAAKRPSNPEEMSPDQLALYAIAMARNGIFHTLNLPFVLHYLVVTKTAKPEVMRIEVKPSREEAVRLIERAKVIYQGMQAGICYPNPSWMCASCGFKERCGKWPRAHMEES